MFRVALLISATSALRLMADNHSVAKTVKATPAATVASVAAPVWKWQDVIDQAQAHKTAVAGRITTATTEEEKQEKAVAAAALKAGATPAMLTRLKCKHQQEREAGLFARCIKDGLEDFAAGYFAHGATNGRGVDRWEAEYERCAAVATAAKALQMDGAACIPVAPCVSEYFDLTGVWIKAPSTSITLDLAATKKGAYCFVNEGCAAVASYFQGNLFGSNTPWPATGDKGKNLTMSWADLKVLESVPKGKGVKPLKMVEGKTGIVWFRVGDNAAGTVCKLPTELDGEKFEVHLQTTQKGTFAKNVEYCKARGEIPIWLTGDRDWDFLNKAMNHKSMPNSRYNIWTGMDDDIHGKNKWDQVPTLKDYKVIWSSGQPNDSGVGGAK